MLASLKYLRANFTPRSASDALYESLSKSLNLELSKQMESNEWLTSQ